MCVTFSLVGCLLAWAGVMVMMVVLAIHDGAVSILLLPVEPMFSKGPYSCFQGYISEVIPTLPVATHGQPHSPLVSW